MATGVPDLHLCDTDQPVGQSLYTVQSLLLYGTFSQMVNVLRAGADSLKYSTQYKCLVTQ